MNKNRKTSNILNVFQYDENGHVVLPATLTVGENPHSSDNTSKIPSTSWIRTYVTGLSYLTGNQSITVSGDATGSGTTAITLTLANTAVTPGTYGSTTLVPVVTVDSKGRITSVTTAAISGSLTFTGDVTGTGTTGTSTGLTLAASGVTAGTYTKVTVDSKGRVTVGANASTTDISEGTNLYYTDARVGAYLTANSYATQSYVGTQVANLVAAAPATLDTLNELAAALGNDPNFATSVATSIGTKQAQLNGTGFVKVVGTTVSYDNNTYLTSFTETDPTVPSHVKSITTTEKANWNTAYGWGNHAIVGYLTSIPTHNQAWSTITSTPTTISGYGITNAYTDAQIQNFFNGANAITGYNKSNWDTAYGWGNHASGGYLTGITSSQVTTALGYTPYNSTNPSGYITGITSSNVTTALGYTPYNATNPNGYITSDSTKLPLAGGTMTGTLTFASISGAAQTVPNTFGAYLHLGDWAVARTAAGAVLVNTAYRADYATDLFDMNISRFTNNSGYITSDTTKLPLAGGTLSGILYSTRNTATGIANNSFNTAKTIIGNIHIQNGGGTSGDNYQAAITFQGGTASEAQAGIYVSNNGSTGTAMGFATTGSYATGPQLFITATNDGVVNFPRATPTVQGNGVWHAGNFSPSSYLLLSGGTMTGTINITNTDIRSNATSNWTGEPGTQGKIQYHANRWYIVSDSSSDRIVQFRRNGTDTSWIANDGTFNGSITGSAGSVAWTNVSSRPTAVSSFTNDSGYLTSVGIGNMTDVHRLFNNMGNTHATYQDFNSVGNFGVRYMQGSTNGPQSGQFYGFTLGLGNDYGIGNYGSQFYWMRNTTNPYIWIRYLEGGSWGGWTKGAAGYADSAGSLSSMNISQFTNNSGYVTSSHQHDTLYYNGAAHLWTGSDGTRNMGWAYHNNNGTGLHWPNNGWHLYPINASDFYIRSGASDCSLKFTKSGTSGSYIHCAADNAIGFLTTGRSWSLRVDDSGGGTFYGGLTVKNAIYLDANEDLYLNYNYGCSIVGVYASTRYQGIFSMGNSWKLARDGTTPGNLYGLSWSHPNAGGQAGYLSTHGLLVMENGTCNTALANGIWTRGDVTAYSDARVKDNVEVIENAIEKIKAIRGVTFTRNDREDTTKRFAGVIAQEVLEVLPEVVTEDALGTYSVAYGNLNALLIEAIKEQQKEIDELKSLINGLTK